MANERIQFTAQIRTAKGTVINSPSANTTVVDTSKSPSYKFNWRDTATSTTNITSVNEGAEAHFVMETENVPDNTTFKYAITGTGINTNDTSTPLTGNLIVKNNKATLKFVTLADLTPEGNETLTITVTDGSVILGKANLIINDTSTGTTVIIRGDVVNAEPYDGATYTVTKGVNLYDYLVPYLGRTPRTGENFNFLVEENVSVTGGYFGSPHAIVLDTRFNTLGTLTLVNRGIILGRGGDNATASAKGKPGNTAIVNNSTNSLKIDNYRIIAGGGGGAGGQLPATLGHAGAPYGWKGQWSSFVEPKFQKRPYGKWGVVGQHGGSSRVGGSPGYVSEGPVTITNIGTKSWWRGREGSLGIGPLN